LKVPLAGELAVSDDKFAVRDKYTGQVIDSLPAMTVRDVKSAVGAASSAMEDVSGLSGFDRRSILKQAANSLREHRSDFVKVLIAETGMTTKQADFEVLRASNIIEMYSEEIPYIGGEAIPLDADARGRGRHGYWFRVPVGVVAAISAFNNPLVLLAHKFGPTFASGNSIVFKPASLAPLAAVTACQLFLESGCPPKSINVLTGKGEILGPVLASDPRVRVISFTGGRDAGEQIARSAGTKRLLMELGSNCPNIVCEDADLELATKQLVDAAYSFQGQNCLHAQRLLIHESVYSQFKDMFLSVASELTMGDPRSPSTDIGPMISETAAKRVEVWVEEAKQAGARIVLGGKRSGVFFEPTLLENVPFTTRITRDEVYGPVSLLYGFSNFRDAVKLANATDYGLQAAIFTGKLDNVLYSLKHLAFGTIMINQSTDFRVDMMPFGGFKGSGLGREGLRHAMESMTEIKMAVYKMS
jgi:glyceraldehyde-3-phosphate dehydrogenase (NADP+)